MSIGNRVALVTGASRGIGAAIARRLAAEGAAVAVNYVQNSAAAGKVVADIQNAGGKAVAVQADIGDLGAAEAMVREAERQLGAVDILVNNAALFWTGDLHDFRRDELDRMRRVNVDGLVGVTRAAVGGMKARGWGRIINISSIAEHGTSIPGTTFYAATKAAVGLLTRRFAMDLGPDGITVNAVAPGFVTTDMVLSGMTADETERRIRSVSEKSMVGRPGRPEDIAHAVAFLAAEEASFITAQTITVDGGRRDYIGHP